MTERAFFDTNVLICLHDRRSPEKRRQAAEVYQLANLPTDQARGLVAEYAQLHVITVRPHHILEAIDLKGRNRLSFWDGLILAAALSAGATVLYSEDFSHGQRYEGLRVENPFLAPQ
jgi:predicted nucleic acid-binding protein